MPDIPQRMSINITEQQRVDMEAIFTSQWGRGMKTRILRELIDLVIALAAEDPKKFVQSVIAGDVKLVYNEKGKS